MDGVCNFLDEFFGYLTFQPIWVFTHVFNVFDCFLLYSLDLMQQMKLYWVDYFLESDKLF
jgi:hypothetical protein